MEHASISELLDKAADKNKFFSDSQRTENGVLRLKRSLLGRFSFKNGNKSPNDIALSLYEIGSVDSLEEGLKYVPLFENQSLKYWSGDNVLKIGSKKTNSHGDARYYVHAESTRASCDDMFI